MVRWIFVSGIEVSICMTAISGVKKVAFFVELILYLINDKLISKIYWLFH